jgi:hypothetical protein
MFAPASGPQQEPRSIANEQALLVLSKNKYDKEAVAAIAENNAEQLRKTISSRFGRTQSQSYILVLLMQHVAVNARFFRPRDHNPDKWIEGCVDRGCFILSLRTGLGL